MRSSFPSTRGQCCNLCQSFRNTNTCARAKTNRIINSVNEDVRIRLKWGTAEYTGLLVSVDSYMNIQLSNAEEFMDGKSTGSLGQVLIRYESSLVGGFLDTIDWHI